jgi:hypothetical protein
LRLPKAEENMFLLVRPIHCHFVIALQSDSKKGKKRKFINTIFHRIISFHSCLCHGVLMKKKEKYTTFCAGGS